MSMRPADHGSRIGVHLLGVGGYLPERIVRNDELAARVDTSDAWIRERTGIEQRHIAGPRETAAFMATEASRAALAHAGIEAAEVDAVIVGTSTPDQAFPATALRVQASLGIARGFGFDVAAACSGFIFALSAAEAFIRCGQARTVLVIGSEVYSRIIDWTDRSTCVLFGDGAGAVVLRAGGMSNAPGDAPGDAQGDAHGGARGVLSTHLHGDGSYGDLLYVDGAVGIREASGHLRMNGREVFRHAVAKLSASVDEALAANGFGHADIDWLVPHQANKRIIDAMGRKLGLPPERVIVTVDRHANTSAASIPLALAEGVGDGRIKRGDLVLMEALGGGMTWGSALVRM